MAIVLVTASRVAADLFMTETALGQSVTALRQQGADFRVMAFCDNKKGLPFIYNWVISEQEANDILVFLHDDVWITDVSFFTELQTALGFYDVVGVAGNRNRYPRQPAWVFPVKLGQWDRPENLLGQVAHGEQPPGKISHYGPSKGPARLLDGVLLAAYSGVLRQSRAFFDERFEFHFYDLDFCINAEQKGLRLGVWSLPIVHVSGGVFGSGSWQGAYQKYLEKYVF
jgi:hypothetical protein